MPISATSGKPDPLVWTGRSSVQIASFPIHFCFQANASHWSGVACWQWTKITWI